MVEMSLEQFEILVREVVESLPDEFRSKIDNVTFEVAEWPTQEDLTALSMHKGVTLFGLYRGVPNTRRGGNYSGVLPDRIVIFAGSILNTTDTLEDAKEQIRKTVLHEIGHYFGMSEEDIRKATMA